MNTYYIVVNEAGYSEIYQDVDFQSPYKLIETSKDVKEFMDQFKTIITRLKNSGKLSRTQAEAAKEDLKDRKSVV